MPRQKIYCYVDETGQDVSSSLFVVVAVVSSDEQETLRQELVCIERAAGTGNRKWHKSRSSRRLSYLAMVMDNEVAAGEVFFGSYPKPLPYFFPFIEVIEYAVKAIGEHPYTARVFVDGIDQKKAAELTNALRLKGLSLYLVRGRRDESEPLIRLADMWAGCVRAALMGAEEERAVLDRALRSGYLKPIKEKAP